MPKIISAVAARTQFKQITKRAAERDERFVVHYRGKPVLIIMSIRDYINTVAPMDGVLARINRASRQRGTHMLTEKVIEKEIRTSRKEK
jgi:hypothetical protein